MNDKEKRIVNRARMTAGRMRTLYRQSGNKDYKEASKAIESLLGIIGKTVVDRGTRPVCEEGGATNG